MDNKQHQNLNESVRQVVEVAAVNIPGGPVKPNPNIKTGRYGGTQYMDLKKHYKLSKNMSIKRGGQIQQQNFAKQGYLSATHMRPSSAAPVSNVSINEVTFMKGSPNMAMGEPEVRTSTAADKPNTQGSGSPQFTDSSGRSPGSQEVARKPRGDTRRPALKGSDARDLFRHAEGRSSAARLGARIEANKAKAAALAGQAAAQRAATQGENK